MNPKNALALIVAYNLSKFDTEAYSRLGFGGIHATHKAASQLLGVKHNTLKNMRDEFDPLHDNPRRGWYQREPRPSRQRIVELFEGMDEEGLYYVVRDILEKASFRTSEEVRNIVHEITTSDRKERGPSVSPAQRIITGRMAEDYFISYHSETNQPTPGELLDTRLSACGYDFEIIDSTQTTFVEVKGTFHESGGILFTDKEWRVATAKKDAFVLALVRDLYAEPFIHFIRNPASLLRPTQHLYTVVDRSWQVAGSQLP